MTSFSMKPKIVRVKIEKDSTGLFFATSPDLKGLLVAVQNKQDLDTGIQSAITDLYAACGVKVFVTLAEDGAGEGYAPWIAFPSSVAEAALRQ